MICPKFGECTLKIHDTKVKPKYSLPKIADFGGGGIKKILSII
jgi:hypothetical protein